jgi:aconitate hydratase
VSEAIETSIDTGMFRKQYDTISDGDENWQRLAFPKGQTYEWESDSTYIRMAPYFTGMTLSPPPVQGIEAARILVSLGDSITTDHISPAGSIKLKSPAGQYLTERGVKPSEFNTFGSRRGNHEIMVRGTFAHGRLRNRLTPEYEGGVTRVLPDGDVIPIYDASVIYSQRETPLGILAGKEYGSGSSRDWAAKGPRLLGVRFVIAESFERIHRSNLVGMGILPLQFLLGQNAESLGLTGEESYSIGLASNQLRELLVKQFVEGKEIIVRATSAFGKLTSFTVTVRIDTPKEVLYYQHGGILQYVLRQLAEKP